MCVKKMQGNSQPCKRTYLWDFTLRKKCKPIQYNWCTRFNKKRGRVLRDGSVCKVRSCLAFPLWRVQFALQRESLTDFQSHFSVLAEVVPLGKNSLIFTTKKLDKQYPLGDPSTLPHTWKQWKVETCGKPSM